MTPTSLYNNPRKRNPSNAEVMQTLQDLQAQVRELQRDKERYMEERSSSQLKETSDKASINCQHKFPEVIKMIIHYIRESIIVTVIIVNIKGSLTVIIGLGHFMLSAVSSISDLSGSWQGKSAQHLGRFNSP